MIQVKTAEGTCIEVDANIVNMIGYIQAALQSNPTVPVDMSMMKKADLEPILEFCKRHSYVNPPPIRRPIPNGDLTSCIPSKFDVEYINAVPFENLFELISVCEFLGIPSLKELASARVAAEFKGNFRHDSRQINSGVKGQVWSSSCTVL
eukprot:TRINITY_DN1378_c0_g1_i15.p1 TRINITY_DN1378_c0_g1~~TRINITY_DN1378_c0_g1_i15.p1  ORF type:complete len:150 (-),score=23.06 TRINITY_DN1378_c0_g1_i15:236-685(-)